MFPRLYYFLPTAKMPNGWLVNVAVHSDGSWMQWTEAYGYVVIENPHDVGFLVTEGSLCKLYTYASEGKNAKSLIDLLRV